MAGGDVALAKSQAVRSKHHRSAAAVRVTYHAGLAAHRRRISTRRGLPPLRPVQAPAAKQTLAMTETSDPGPTDQPGWFKAPGRAGWGVKQGGAETMLGVYSRPVTPVMGGPDIYHHEPVGAAGVALTFKLGH
jgi:hypothetical protein